MLRCQINEKCKRSPVFMLPQCEPMGQVPRGTADGTPHSWLLKTVLRNPAGASHPAMFFLRGALGHRADYSDVILNLYNLFIALHYIPHTNFCTMIFSIAHYFYFVTIEHLVELRCLPLPALSSALITNTSPSVALFQ